MGTLPDILSRVRNAFWYAHTVLKSKVELYEANSYDLPDSLGSFDIGVLGSVLLRCSSPVRIIEQVAERVQMIISPTRWGTRLIAG